MNLQQEIQHLLKQIGAGHMASTAYDTAWLARLVEIDRELGERSLNWLRSHQLADGSWGAGEFIYYHDRLVCTLIVLIALARYGQPADRTRIERAQLALGNIVNGLSLDSSKETIGFEMLVPTLVAEAKELGVLQNQLDELAGRLTCKRAAKLLSLPEGTVNRHVTLGFSSEMIGNDGLHLLDLENLQEANGSVGNSPSATAYFALNVAQEDPLALSYLRDISAKDGSGFPHVSPFDVFERAWVLRNLALTGDLDEQTLSLCQPHLDFLEQEWEPERGVCWASDHEPKDSDDSAVTFEVLTRFGRTVDVEALLSYEREDHFMCFPLELSFSISAHVHLLGALRLGGFPVQHASVQKIISVLKCKQYINSFWFDKWQASPYYTTAHAIMAAVGYCDDLVANAVQWILETRQVNGAWGYYTPTAEETAYCLQALVIWKRNGGHVPDEVLEQGATWLAAHVDPPYAPLWIGKCLYSPELVVRSTILSALVLVTEEVALSLSL